MKHILTLSIRLVLLLALFFVGVDNVSAAACGITSDGQDLGNCAGGWYCINNSCVQNSGCWENVCSHPNTCMGDICMPGGGGGVECPCGMNTQGTGCKSCPGECTAPINCNLAAGWTVAYNQAKEVPCGSVNYCSLGNAQTLGGCCGSGKVDENGEWFCGNPQKVNYACCPPGTQDTCEMIEQGNYTWSTEYNWRFSCKGNHDIFVSTVQSNRVKQVLKICTDYDEVKEKCVGEKYDYVVYYWDTTCLGISKVCTCQSVCTNTAPTNVSVIQGSSATSATVSWTPGSGGGSQRLYVDQSQTEVNNGCPTPNACEVNATLASSTNSYIVTGLLPQTTYYFRVTNYASPTCNIGATPASYTTPNVTLSGRVYLDLNNNCATTTPWNLGGLAVSVRGTGYGGSVGGDGRFGFYGGDSTPISYLDLTGYGSSYIPSTAAGCNAGATLTSVANPSSTNYFYLTPRREAWWRVVGGSVYSTGNVRSELPMAETNLIEPGVGGALGALMRASGTVDTGSGNVSLAGYSAQTKYRGKLMNYDYFAAHMGVTPSTVNYWAADTMNKPANNPERVFYYQNPSGSEASVTSPWTVAAGESYVVFVNGDLRIANNIVIEQGGFLAFIVNGEVRVSPAVTDVAGLFVVDGVLSTESNTVVDVPVEFQGSVVAWGGVNFGRDLVAANLTQAGESFVYRPDLLVNMPEAMKVFALRWEEVVPGTIGQ